jgi:uncharacterized protein YidB (DUF937 family)
MKMDLMKLATQLFLSKLGAKGSELSENGVVSALKALLPTTAAGDLDLAALVAMFSKGDLAALASTWLGDGGNAALSPAQLMSLLGQSKLQGFASSLGLDSGVATRGLAQMLPELIDKNSRGGDLLSSLGGGEVLGSLAKNMLGGLFK